MPLLGFGHALYQGVIKAVEKDGFIGVLTGGLSATAAGIAAVIVFAIIAALVSKPKIK